MREIRHQRTFALTPYAGSGEFNANFGQRPFAYAPPTGFKCLNTRNLPTVDSRKMTGTPDLVWIKSRSAATDHALYDSSRGVGLDLAINLDAAETSQPNGVTQLTKTGFVVGNLAKLNTSAATYVSWLWKKGAIPGFDIINYVGNGTAGRTVAHALGVKPAFIIVKNRLDTPAGGQSWAVYHQSLTSAKWLMLASPAAATTSSIYWNNTEPTSSAVTVGSHADVNYSGDNLVMYAWAEVPGFSRFESYTGNGSTDGPFVWCGFRPWFVLFKRTDSAENWQIFDSARANNRMSARLYPNLSNVEYSDAEGVDFLSNGFKLRSTSSAVNASGGTYIFAAFAEAPFKYAGAR